MQIDNNEFQKLKDENKELSQIYDDLKKYVEPGRLNEEECICNIVRNFLDYALWDYMSSEEPIKLKNLRVISYAREIDKSLKNVNNAEAYYGWQTIINCLLLAVHKLRRNSYELQYKPEYTKVFSDFLEDVKLMANVIDPTRVYKRKKRRIYFFIQKIVHKITGQYYKRV